MVPLLFLMVFMGVYPRPFLARSEASVKQIQERVDASGRRHDRQNEFRPSRDSCSLYEYVFCN